MGAHCVYNMYKKYTHIIIMSSSPSIYDTFIKNTIKEECAKVAYLDCKYREIAYIKCMNQTNENSRHCNYMSDILHICCNQQNVTQTNVIIPEPAKDTTK
jgi:hypothetical protein